MIDFRDIKNNQRKYIKNKSELTIALKQSIDTFEIKSNKIDIDSHEKKFYDLINFQSFLTI